jgi:hypothetical protein
MIIIIPFLHVKALAIWPFIFLQKREDKENAILVNHERIHHIQQLELAWIGFFLAYIILYLWNRIRHKKPHYLAYRDIIFEKEAFRNEANLKYLSTRNPFNYVH